MPYALENDAPFKIQLLVCYWSLLRKEHTSHGLPSDHAGRFALLRRGLLELSHAVVQARQQSRIMTAAHLR